MASESGSVGSPSAGELPHEDATLLGAPLYVHLPFCAAKCHYCDFFSVAATGHDVDAMLASILREARERASWRPRTVFLGGGTPSLLSIEQLRHFLNGLQEITDFRSSSVETTAECNPESLDYAKVCALLELGVTRLSIGFQSLHDETLALFGRVHSVDDSFRAFEAARRAGVRRLNVDLIFAAPGQTTDAWTIDLERILALRPDHISAYNLTFEEETLFRRWLEQGRVARAPEELELELFHATRQLLGSAGYGAYEISNFAVSGQRCLHNINYWHNGEYLGIGPSAVSKLRGVRSGNARSIFDYRRRIDVDARADVWSEAPPARTRLAETWWLGLRLAEGLSPATALERAQVTLAELDDEDPTASIVDRLLTLGLLQRSGDRVQLSDAGLPLADAVAKEFLALAVDEQLASGAPRSSAVAK